MRAGKEARRRRGLSRWRTSIARTSKRPTRAMIAKKEEGVQPLADTILPAARRRPAPAGAGAVERGKRACPTRRPPFNWRKDILSPRADPRRRGHSRPASARSIAARACCAPSRCEGESVYAQYADYREPVLRAAGHRILAINRGERRNGSGSRWNVTTSRRCKSSAAR